MKFALNNSTGYHRTAQADPVGSHSEVRASYWTSATGHRLPTNPGPQWILLQQDAFWLWECLDAKKTGGGRCSDSLRLFLPFSFLRLSFLDIIRWTPYEYSEVTWTKSVTCHATPWFSQHKKSLYLVTSSAFTDYICLAQLNDKMLCSTIFFLLSLPCVVTPSAVSRPP